MDSLPTFRTRAWRAKAATTDALRGLLANRLPRIVSQAILGQQRVSGENQGRMPTRIFGPNWAALTAWVLRT
jgi:hypothetical protein